MLERKKISVIGAGFTGATTAFLLAAKELGDVVLVDIPSLENPTKGKALDMLEAMPVLGSDAHVVGTSDYEDTAGSDLVIITAGLPRKPGMSRDDLVNTNANIVKSVTEQVVRYSPDACLIVLSNPVDAMTYVAYKTSGFPKQRVIGQAGVLDTARFNTFVAMELGVSVEDVRGFVLGVHGDDMVPLVRYANVGGVPLEKLLPKERIDAIVERTRNGGGEIVSLMGNASAYYAPAASLLQMAESILKDKRRVLPAIAYLEGEYGYRDLTLGVPTVLGKGG
ncbi:MAG: malate dehydrogenase, partial [Alicyclobacillus mali]|uniref:malate dehydrogenase n=1 Tax=Alicyclobacillus mali (ex Roth et al. 2021) TaxID=1123961 RepID=UPI0023F50A31